MLIPSTEAFEWLQSFMLIPSTEAFEWLQSFMLIPSFTCMHKTFRWRV